MKKSIAVLCLVVFAVQLILIIYFQRGVFAAKYDTEYWKDRYEHSQYQLPLSKRVIGDDGLFAYSGYRLINGDDPFSINNDKPPAAKYLFGLSILLFHNPLYAVLFFGFCTLILFYFIAIRFLKNNSLALLAATLLFLDPLFFSQFWITGLDLIQLFFLLLNVLLLVNIGRFKKWNILIALGAGLSLGLFAEVKPPILLPIIFILETTFMFYKGFKKEYLILIIGVLLGSLLPYLRFIYLGNSLIDVLRVHNFMASIYLQSQLKAHLGAIWLTLFAGKFPNITSGSLISVAEWWLLWPILTLFGIIMAFRSFLIKKNPVINKGLAIFLLTSLVIFTFIPSYPRYLVIVFPFLYLFGIGFFQQFLNKGKLFLYLTLLIFGIINSFLFLQPKPDVSLNGFYYNLSRLYFHDVYQESIGNKEDLGLTRGEFRYIANKAINDAGVREIEVKELSRSIPIFATTGSLKVGLTYKTQDLGPFYEEKAITLIKQENEWKVKWDWNIILNGFTPNKIISTSVILGKRGRIIDSKGNILASDEASYLVLFNPKLMDSKKEQEMIKQIESYGYRGDISIHNAYLENVLPETHVPLMTFYSEIKDEEREKLLTYPGIRIIDYPSRIYDGSINFKGLENTFYEECCTRIYSSHNYHGIKGPEMEYDKILWGYSGGKILMKDDRGAIIRTVFAKEKKDGEDVILR